MKKERKNNMKRNPDFKPSENAEGDGAKKGGV